jgi:hypothetical protein
MRKVRSLVVAATGAAAAYFLDPAQGHARRARTQDQVRSWTKSRRRDLERTARFEAGVRAGEEAKARGAGHYHPHGDTDLQEHLRMVLSSLDAPTGDVTVEVVEGVVRVRGQVEDRDHVDQVLGAIRDVPGVVSVESLLHLPGTPAPNKAAAIDPSDHAAAALEGATEPGARCSVAGAVAERGRERYGRVNLRDASMTPGRGDGRSAVAAGTVGSSSRPPPMSGNSPVVPRGRPRPQRRGRTRRPPTRGVIGG